MSYNLFLDDERKPSQVTWVELPFVGWDVVRSYDDFCSTISKSGLPTRISFDHDFAPEHYRPSMYDADRHYSNYYTDGTFKIKTGFDCAKWLIDYCLRNKCNFPEYYVHSMNPIGRENIVSIIESFKRAMSAKVTA